MSIHRSVLAVVLCAAPVLGAPLGHAQPPDRGLGGCRPGSVMTGRFTPGSGSAGQSVRREATLTDCASPLLPGITAGRFDATIPWNALNAVSAATFTWSDGSFSTAQGYGNGLWLIIDGPARGHGIQVNVADTWDGWYYSPLDITATSATFVS